MSYNKPMSPPPAYPAPAHPPPTPMSPGSAQDYYNQGPPPGPPGPGGYYPHPQPHPQYGSPYGSPPPGGMYYPQQPPHGHGPYPPMQQGYYADGRDDRGRGAGGICAGIMAALACCCCLDIIF